MDVHARRLRVDVLIAEHLTAPMRFLSVLLPAGILLSGCATDKPSAWSLYGTPVSQPVAAPVITNAAPKLIVTPEIMLVGKVVRFSSEGRFVVLNFPVGHLPGENQRLEVYRQGLKVGRPGGR